MQPPLIEYDVGDNALRDAILKEPIVVENGTCALPNRLGLGIELDHGGHSPFQRALGPAGCRRQRVDGSYRDAGNTVSHGAAALSPPTHGR